VSYHNFRGHRHGRAQKTSGFSQATTRHAVTTYDQHGRRYTFPAENQTGMPCGLIEPSFQAPYQPDPQYIVVNGENTSECYVDWRGLIRDRIAAMKEYHATAVQIASKKGWDIPKMGDYSDDLIASHPSGKPPRAYQLAVACEQGNPWALGFSETPDPRLTKYLESAVTEIDVEIESYNFGADSYQQEVASPGTAPARRSSFATRRGAARARPFDAAGLVNLAEASAVAEAEDALAREEHENDEALDEFSTIGSDGEEETELTELDGIESLPTDAEGAESSLGVREIDDEPLVDDDEGDPQGLGGRTVKPGNMDRAQRQAPRRPGQTSVTRKRGERASASGAPVETGAPRRGNKPFVREGRKSLADGAVPVVSD
jgi:hypothetical protein